MLLSNFEKESGRREWIAENKHANKRKNGTMAGRGDSWICARAGVYSIYTIHGIGRRGDGGIRRKKVEQDMRETLGK